MTYIGDDRADDDVLDTAGHDRGRLVLTGVVLAFLALIVVNIGIAVVGGERRPTPVPTPSPVVTARPTAPAPSPSRSRPPRPTVAVVPSPVASPLPQPGVGTGDPSYAGALAALTPGGDIVLIDADTGRTLRTLVTHQPGMPVRDISWDGLSGTMYFDRDDGTCPTVWRYRLDFGRPELFAGGAQPVVSRDGTRIAVRGTGCGPGNAISDGVALYDTASGQPFGWAPSPGATADFQGALRVVDMDWRPDGAAIAVTLTGSGRYVYKLVTLSVTPPVIDLVSAPEIPMLHDFRETFYEVEYVGARLLLVGHCCDGVITEPTERLALRDAETGVVTSITDTPVTSVTASRTGEVRFLEAGRDGTGPLRSVIVPEVGDSLLNPLPGVQPSFLRLDW